jgi:flavin-dependent dehydrogenase
MKCDVVVLGAGPAGLAAAIVCAEAGLDVRILDRSTFPRSRVGEAAHPGVEVLLKRLGVAQRVHGSGFVRHTGIWVERHNRKEFIPFGETAGCPWRGFQLWRPTFDQILLDRAMDLGGEFIAPCILSEAVPSGRGVRIISSAGSFETKFVVDGTGRGRWLARHWSLPIHAFSATLVARYRYAEGQCGDLDGNPIFTLGSSGWEWTARVRENLYQWIALRYARSKSRFPRIPARFEGLRAVGRTCGADVTWTLIDNCASSVHFLVGDAAAVLDPSSSHGILRAISSGILAANCIGLMLCNSSARDRQVDRYRLWQRKWFLHDVNIMKFFPETRSQFGRD